MKTSLKRFMASAVAGKKRGFPATSLALLPPIPLYRRLLRTHRKRLPKEMRLLGDEYVKSEFRSHQKIENPMHIIGFLTEWQMYAQKLEGDNWIGERMDPAKIEKMSGKISQRHNFLFFVYTLSPPYLLQIFIDAKAHVFTDQQLAQMYELMQAIRNKQLEDQESETLNRKEE